jgi:dihydrofolate reductase
MNRIIAIHYTTLDGVAEDPDGRDGRPFGGWAFRYGPEAIAGDKFDVASNLEAGTLAFGRRTWDAVSSFWPERSGGYADVMNAAPKLVVSSSPIDEDRWSGSTVRRGDGVEVLRDEATRRDVVVIGSLSLTQALLAADALDELRLIVFPTVLGTGRHLFPDGVASNLTTVSSEVLGQTARLRFERAAA